MENNLISSTAININNISTPASSIASIDTVSTFKDPNFYKLIVKKRPRAFDSNIREKSLPFCSGYATPDTNFFAYLQRKVNSETVNDMTNGLPVSNKRKYNVLGLLSTVKKSVTVAAMERNNQLLNVEKSSGSVSSDEPTNRVLFHMPPTSVETINQTSSIELPKGFYEALESCAKLTKYVEHSYSSIFGAMSKMVLKDILKKMTEWERRAKRRTDRKEMEKKWLKKKIRRYEEEEEQKKEEKQDTMMTHDSGSISSDDPTNRASSPVPSTSVETTNQASSMDLPKGFYEVLEFCSQLTAYVEASPSSIFSKKLKMELRKVLRRMIEWKRRVTKRKKMKKEWLQIQLRPLYAER